MNPLLLLFALPLAAALSVADFRPALFHSSQPSGFYTVDTGPATSGQILCFSDLNGDKYTDYIASSDRNSNLLEVYYWTDATAAFTSDIITLQTTGQIAEVMAGDVDSDGINELVVTYLVNGTYSTFIYDLICGTTCQSQIQKMDFTALTGMSAVPFIIDVVGDGSVALFTFKGTERTLYSYSVDRNKLLARSWASYLTSGSAPFAAVGNHFAAQVDMNGDCSADLLLVSMQGTTNSAIEYYVKTGEQTYSLASRLLTGKDIVWLTFADIDANGANDLFLVAKEGNAYIPYLLINSNSPTDICQLFPKPSLVLNRLQQVVLPSNYKLVADSQIRFGDFNFDGLPDILGIFSLEKIRTASILTNLGGRFGRFQTVNVREIEQVGNPLQAALFDFTQNGKIDLLITSQVTRQDGKTARQRISVVNNIIEDTLFIKILPLLPSSSPDFSSNQLASAVAVTISWRITNLDGDKTISVLSQKIQSTHGALQLPFVTCGLGRTNNYIEELTVGYPGLGQKQSWSPIIPNSQLMVQRRVQGDWVLQTLLKDNSRVYDVIYISIACLLGMGMLILFLNWRENIEDKRDHYNFIQMIR